MAKLTTEPCFADQNESDDTLPGGSQWPEARFEDGVGEKLRGKSTLLW
jgi:hypothetical protein